MPSISEVVEEFVEQRKFIEIALTKGIINYTKLAEDLIPDLENDPKLRGKEITNSAVMMALRRLGKKLESDSNKLNKIASSSISQNDHGLELFNTMYQLFEITVIRKHDIMEKIKKLYDIVNLERGEFLTITQGIYEITIISNMRHRDEIIALFEEEEIQNVDIDLASISLKIPKESIEIPGILYTVLKQLYWDTLNVVEIVSTYTEMSFIIKEIDLPMAHRSLSKLVERK